MRPRTTASPALHVRNAAGFQHGHGEEKDEYYYRPLVSGKDLFTYIAHVPPHGGVPPSTEEAKLFELSLFMLDGELIAIRGSEEFVIRPGEALHIPRDVPFGVRNETDRSASFILSFAPPPRSGTIEEMLQSARDKGRRVFEAKEFDPIIGETKFPLR
jgi:quercetin dioxygenase-like cupin family protein